MRKYCWAALLVALLLLSVTGCEESGPDEGPAPTPGVVEPADPEKPQAEPVSTEEVHEAYRVILQKMVLDYGPPKVEYSSDDDPAQVVIAELLDLTGDGQEELFVVYRSSEQQFSAIYTCQDGEAVCLWQGKDTSSDWRVARTGDTVCIFPTITYRQWFHGLYVIQDGKFVNLWVWDDSNWTEEERAWFEANGGLDNINSENTAYVNLCLRRIGLSLDDEWEDLAYITTGDSTPDVFHSEEEMIAAYQEVADRCRANLEALGVRMPKPKVSAQTLLTDLAYYGDRSRCKMDRQMAEAYAKAIESMPLEDDSHPDRVFEAVLVDLAGDGMPVLMMASLPKVEGNDNGWLYMNSVWDYENGKANKVVYSDTLPVTDSRWMGGEIVSRNGVNYFHFYQDAGSSSSLPADQYYAASNGKLTLAHTCVTYHAGVTETGELDTENKLLWQLPPDALETYAKAGEETLEGFLENGWKFSGSPQDIFLILWDGKPISEVDIREKWEFTPEKHFWERWVFDLPTTPRAQAVELLRQYAQVAGRPSYDFPEVSVLLGEKQLSEILALLGIDGEIGEIYQIGEDLYYVVVYVDGNVSGCGLVKETLAGEGTKFRLVSADETPATQEALEAAALEDQTISNITLDYNQAGEDKTAYLEEALSGLDGTVPNDAAKGALAGYVESAVAESGATTVKCRKNGVAITGKTVRESLSRAEETYTQMTETLGDVALNKEITIILRVVCTGLDQGEPIQVAFDPSILEELGEANQVQVLLGDGQHSVSVTAATLAALCQQHGGVVVQLQKTGEGVYTITFLTPEGETLERLPESLTFTLPADGETATILATYTGGADNWGGQYDPVNGALSFATPYTGTYEIADNAAAIRDIAECDPETAAAIRFMVSKGYFSLEDGEKFDPDGNLDRYDFSEALVRMFFALDRSLETTFSDVPTDSPYYPYVASGEQEAIIEGFEDGTFRGEAEVLREQVIALCSRTLAEKKGYSYPSDPASYLTFDDAGSIANWAKETTALAVRETLIEGGGSLGPKEAISRGEAALILYRLFMLLYETPQAALTVDTGGDGSMTPVVAGGAAVLVLAGAGTAVLWKRKSAAKADAPSTDEAPDSPAQTTEDGEEASASTEESTPTEEPSEPAPEPGEEAAPDAPPAETAPASEEGPVQP